MQQNYKKRKSKEQKLWEQRKLKMAGVEFEEIKTYNENEEIEIEIKDKQRFINLTYLQNEYFDFTNPLYEIGNRPSKYFDKFRNTKFAYQFETSSSTILQSQTKDDDYKKLPVYKHKIDFLQAFDNYDVLLVTGETGCGKSSLLPKFLFDKYKFNICITQPRRISVKNLYERMKSFYTKEVGYAIQYEQFTTVETKIKYVTEGILLREITSDPLLSKYDVIICDEVHERSIDLDIILGYLKIIKEKRKNLKIVLMSATLQILDFAHFFNAFVFNFEGNLFPVDIEYLKVDVNDYIEWTTKKILSINKKDEKGDILVFLSGKEDINQVYNILKSLSQEIKNLEIIPLYAEILNEVFDKIFKQDLKKRKCILSTNIAETSVTIPNIKFVIDSGFHKVSFYDYNLGDRLIKYPISKENAIQRSGRAGRTGPGICFRMYTKDSYEKYMRDKNIPDILKSNISNTILLILSTNFKKIDSFPFLSKPPSALINAGIITLQSLCLIDNAYNLSEDGKNILKLGIDVILGKLILEGIKNDCSYDSTLLASILSLDTHNIFQHFENETNYLNFFVKENEFLTLINLFKEGFKNIDFAPPIVKRVKIIHTKILKRIYALGYKETFSENINKVILKTFFLNICRRQDTSYVNLCTNVKYKLPNLEFDGTYICFYKLFKTKTNDHLIQISCAVDPKDILCYCSDFYKDKKIEETHSKQILIYDNLYEKFVLESDIE